MPDGLRRRIEDCEVRVAGEQTLTFTASTEQVARDEEIILAKAWDTEQFEKNPVFLWSHDAWSLPIGRVVGIRKVTRGSNRRLEIDVEFAGLEQLHEQAETIHLLYRDGFLKAVSVGYRVRERRDPTEAEAKLGARGVITKAELLEVSAVTVPADTDALIQNADTPEDVREAAIALRSAMAEQTGPQDTRSETIMETITVADLSLVREAICEVTETLSETISAQVITEVRALISEATEQTTPDRRHPADRQRVESEEDDFYGLTDKSLNRAREPEGDDL